MPNTLKKMLSRITPSTLINFEYPDPTRVFGLSTSHWTNVVNWKVAKEAGIKFAYIKAFNGINTTRYWKENYEGAMKEGIKVGGYTWLYPPSVASPGTQARKFADYMKAFPTQLPNCVDFEWTSPSNPSSGDLWGFVKPYEDVTGKKPAIYTAPGYWNQYGSTNSVWADYPLWQAQYNQGRYDIIKPWKGYEFLQWSQTGEGVKYGVPTYGERACELNYYNGTLEQFEAAYGDGATPPIEPPIIIQPSTGEVKMITAKVNNDVANFRSAPVVETANLLPPQLKRDDVVEGDLITASNWLHVTKVNGVDRVGYVAAWLLSNVMNTEPPVTVGDFPNEVGLTINGVTKQYVPK